MLVVTVVFLLVPQCYWLSDRMGIVSVKIPLQHFSEGPLPEQVEEEIRGRTC